jgi:hypothetical protein
MGQLIALLCGLTSNTVFCAAFLHAIASGCWQGRLFA